MTTLSHEHDHHEEEIASKVTFGFWIYLMTSAILFAALFATYAVLHNNTYGSVNIQQITILPCVLMQTGVLLASVFTCGISAIAFHKKSLLATQFWLFLTFILALFFVLMQWHGFVHLFKAGYTWQGSAFLSSYFTLLGMHFFNVIAGLIWIVVLMIQLAMKAPVAMMKTRLTCLGLFFSFLNIIWVAIFTIIYLLGAI